MSRPPRTHSPKPLTTEIREYRSQLDAGCQRVAGVSGAMYRALDRLFNIMVLAVTVYFVQYTDVAPVLAMAFAVLLIAGAESLQHFMLSAGQLQQNQERSDGE